MIRSESMRRYIQDPAWMEYRPPNKPKYIERVREILMSNMTYEEMMEEIEKAKVLNKDKKKRR